MAKKKVNTENEVFLNPFESGVSYVDFKNSIPEGVTVKEHCKDILTEDEIQWIEDELGYFALNNKIEQVEELEENLEN